MRITRYASEHLDAILALHRTATTNLHLGISQDEDETDLMQVDQVYLANGGEFLVGLFQGKLIAMGGFKKLSGTAAELRRIRIQPKLQGRGYGGLLLRELERRAVERDIRTKMPA